MSIPVLRRVVAVVHSSEESAAGCFDKPRYFDYVFLQLACGHQTKRLRSRYKDSDRVKCPDCTNGVSPGE